MNNSMQISRQLGKRSRYRTLLISCHSSLIGSNHFGIAGYYSMQALKENMIVSKSSLSPLRRFHFMEWHKWRLFSTLFIIIIFLLQGMSFTNTSPLVVPTRGKQVSSASIKPHSMPFVMPLSLSDSSWDVFPSVDCVFLSLGQTNSSMP